MPYSESLQLFLSQGVKPFIEKHQLANPNCFISYAWGKDKIKQEMLQKRLTDLHQALCSAGFATKLDIKNMQETVSDYMAEGVANADIIFIICTPELQTRALEFEDPETVLSPAQLNDLTPNQFDRYGFNNLQKELWYARQKFQQKSARVFLLLYDGDCNTAVPENFFASKDFFVRDVREAGEQEFEQQLLGTSNPLGLIPSLLNLPGQAKHVEEAYEKRLAQYQKPESDLCTKACLKIKEQVTRFGEEEEIEQLSNFYVPLNAQVTEQTSNNREDLQEVMGTFFESKQKVCLLLGHAGSGKTTYGLMLQDHLWRDYRAYDNEKPILIRIDLKKFNQDSGKDAVRTVLQKQCHLNDQEIASLQCSDFRITRQPRPTRRTQSKHGSRRSSRTA